MPPLPPGDDDDGDGDDGDDEDKDPDYDGGEGDGPGGGGGSGDDDDDDAARRDWEAEQQHSDNEGDDEGEGGGGDGGDGGFMGGHEWDKQAFEKAEIRVKEALGASHDISDIEEVLEQIRILEGGDGEGPQALLDWDLHHQIEIALTYDADSSDDNAAKDWMNH